MPDFPVDPPAHPSPSVGEALVCVVDDNPGFRRAARRLLESAGFRCETYASAADYLVRRPQEGVRCVILDVRMPGMDGPELQRSMAGWDEQVVFLTAHGDVRTCAEAMKAGAVDFLLKPVDESALLAAVRTALDRAESARKESLHRHEVLERLGRLTPRETDVMRMVVAGHLNKQIAAALGMAEKTVKIHRGRVMRKAGVVSVADLVRLCQVAGIEGTP